MAGFNYVNENNPISIGDNEAQTMINARIDRGYLEYFEYDVDEDSPVPHRRTFLPDGREVKIIPNLNTPEGQWTEDGMVMWKKASETNYYSPNCEITPEMIANGFNNWDVSVAAYTGNTEIYIPQAAGQYFYCATITDNRTNVESAPFYFPYVEVTETDVEQKNGIRFVMQHVRDLDDNYTIKIYRMPIGGTSWFLVFDHSGFITNDPSGEIRFDPKPDEYLTEACETTELTSSPFRLNSARSLTLFDDKLWVAFKDYDQSNEGNRPFGLLYFSRTGDYAQFPATNFFTFPDPVVGLATYDQQLIVLTEKELYYIYGDPDEYSMKLIDYKFNGIVQNSGQALGSYAYFMACDDVTEQTKPKGLFMFNGSVVAEISQKINKEFPSTATLKNWVLDNRYFIFELLNTDNDAVRIVYDTMANGFCMVNKTVHGFRYRTKEFSVLPNGKTHMKKICIRAKGAFIVYVVADGKKVLTKHRRTSDKPFDHYLYVKPNRASSFSFVFEGTEGTEIYDWSVVE